MRKALLTVLLPAMLVAGGARAEVDWSRVDAVMDREGAIIGEVHKYALPRDDLQVTLDGVEIRPALALGGWIAFQPMGDHSMMMGDLVLTETEAAPVLRSLLADGVGVTGLHNHLLRATPATLYMHVSGSGDPVVLARAVREALAETKTPFAPPKASSGAAGKSFDADGISAILGAKGKNNDGVWQFSFPRPDEVRVAGVTMAPAMGVATALNFEPTGEGTVAIAGDFVVLGKEVARLLKTLQSNGVEVMALHNHMLSEEPRLFFVHVFAHDDARKLARALRAGLDLFGSDRSSIQPAPGPGPARPSK